MDWQKQMEQMIGQWADVQRTLWDQWVDTVRSFGQMPTDPEALRQEYERRMRDWEASMSRALEAHQEWAANWGGDTSRTDPAAALSGAGPWMEQMQTLFGEWAERQNGLWQAWFTALQSLDPANAKGMASGQEPALNDAWQTATAQAQQALDQWATLIESMASAMTGLSETAAAEARPEVEPAARRKAQPAAEPKAGPAAEPEQPVEQPVVAPTPVAAVDPPQPAPEAPLEVVPSEQPKPVSKPAAKPAAKRVSKPRTRAPAAAETRPASAGRRRAPRKGAPGSGDKPDSTD